MNFARALFRSYTWQIVACAFALAVGAAFVGGYKLRAMSCELVAAKGEATQSKAVAKAVTAARADDHANNASAAATEQARVTAAARTDGAFSAIDNQVNDYAKDDPRARVRPASEPPVCVDRGGARVAPVLPDDPVRDARFLRAWNEANAGHATAEPGHPSGAAATRD